MDPSLCALFAPRQITLQIPYSTLGASLVTRVATIDDVEAKIQDKESILPREEKW